MAREVFGVKELAELALEFVVPRNMDATFPLKARVDQARWRCKSRLPIVLAFKWCTVAKYAQGLETCRMIQMQLAKAQEDRLEIQRLRAGIGELNRRLQQLHQAARG
jgi:hypothetical protein